MSTHETTDSTIVTGKSSVVQSTHLKGKCARILQLLLTVFRSYFTFDLLFYIFHHYLALQKQLSTVTYMCISHFFIHFIKVPVVQWS